MNPILPKRNIACQLNIWITVFLGLISFNHHVLANTGVDPITTAIQHRICFENFWWGRDTFRLGKTVPVFLGLKDDVTFAWTEQLSNVRGAKRWANFFEVITDDDRTRVNSAYGFNIDLMQNTPQFEDARGEVFSGGRVQKVQLRVPSDCTPHFTGVNAEKEKIIRKVEAAIVAELQPLDRRKFVYHPVKLKVIIANFNLDYPETLVLVPRTGKVFHVALHNVTLAPTHPVSGGAAYPVMPEYNPHAIAAVKGKIIRYGLVRQVIVRE